MIASKQKAPKYGPGRLTVDGRDGVVLRKTTFAFKPSKRQERELHRLLSVSCEVYNAGLQERRDAYRIGGKTVTLHEQFNALTGTREVRPEVFDFGLQPLRGSLRRLDEAMAAFFRRVKAGETPGFPRFKGWRRFNTAMWDEPSSWKADPDRRVLYIQGVGDITQPKSALRQLGRFVGRFVGRGGEMRTLTVTRRKAGTGWVWRATVGFRDVAVEKTIPTNGEGGLVGCDRGIKVTLALSDGTMVAMPHWMAEARDDIVALQRHRATKTRYSRAWRHANRRVAKTHGKVAERADNWARQTANALVAAHDVIVLEDLNLVAMTRSAKGAIEEPGRGVAQKAGLNRSLQDAALGRLAHWIHVKAESAGRRVWLVDPRYTSQRCSTCQHTDAANRPDQATFACVACGHADNADVNAAMNIAQLGAQAERAWNAAGRPSLERPKPRMRRGLKDKPKVALAA